MKIDEIRIALSIVKLKWIRALLAPILRLHIWLELRVRGQ